MLDSSLIPAPVGKTLQVDPNFDQNYKTLNSMILSNFFKDLSFLLWWAQQIYKRKYSQFSPKECPRRICPKIMQPYILWSALMIFLNIVLNIQPYIHDIWQRFVLKHFSTQCTEGLILTFYTQRPSLYGHPLFYHFFQINSFWQDFFWQYRLQWNTG